jgi:hypothetical protein
MAHWRKDALDENIKLCSSQLVGESTAQTVMMRLIVSISIPLSWRFDSTIDTRPPQSGFH